MSSSKDAPTAELVLAAIDRAIMQNVHRREDAPAFAICNHLALSGRSGAWRVARRHLAALEAARDVRQGRRNGIEVWALTEAGVRRLERAARGGELPALPESPQHRLWRDSRRVASQEIDRFRTDMADTLEEAMRLLQDAAVSAAAWLELSPRLARAADRLGAVLYCLGEWPEPQEDSPDMSDGPRLRIRARFGEPL